MNARTPLNPMNRAAQDDFATLWFERVPLGLLSSPDASVAAIELIETLALTAALRDLPIEELAEQAGIRNDLYLSLLLRGALADEEIDRRSIELLADALGLAFSELPQLVAWTRADQRAVPAPPVAEPEPAGWRMWLGDLVQAVHSVLQAPLLQPQALRRVTATDVPAEQEVGKPHSAFTKAAEDSEELRVELTVVKRPTEQVDGQWVGKPELRIVVLDELWAPVSGWLVELRNVGETLQQAHLNEAGRASFVLNSELTPDAHVVVRRP